MTREQLAGTNLAPEAGMHELGHTASRAVVAPLGPEQTETGGTADLYSRIIDLADLPPAPESVPDFVRVEILTDDMLRIGAEKVKLGSHQLYLFNALLLLRDKPRSAAELRAFGFYPDASHNRVVASTLTHAMKALNAKFVKGANTEAVVKTGEGRDMNYQLRPGLVLSDIRGEYVPAAPAAESDETTHIRRMKAAPRLGRINLASIKEADFKKYSDREEAIVAIAKKYKERPEATREAERFRKSVVTTEALDDSVRLYMKKINQYRLLSRDDEVVLFARIEKGLELYNQLGPPDDPDLTAEQVSAFLDGLDLTPTQEAAFIDLASARQAVFNSNLKLVASIAKNYTNYMSFLDLIQEGNEGLSKAISRFGVIKGHKFSTYSTWWIRQSITRAIADKARTIRLPVHMNDRWKEANRISRGLEQELGREPTDAEIGAKMKKKMTAKEVEVLKRAGALYLKSTNEPVSEEGDSEFGDFIADPRGGIDQQLEQVARDDVISRAFARAELDKQEAVVISLHTGVYVDIQKHNTFITPQGEKTYDDLMNKIPVENGAKGKGLGLKTIGFLLGISHSTIIRIEKDGMKRLQRYVDEHERDGSQKAA
jgi:RNA polymerase sigma factor (sigma-70 family)